MKLAWFSAGITSAVACKLAVDLYEDVELYYIHIGSAHKDNKRFISDCEQWIGKRINVVANLKGYRDQFDVIAHTKYVNGASGARCTLELKKKVRQQVEDDLQPESQVFGFEYSRKEINRAIRFKDQHPHTNPLFPLIESKLTKNACAGILLSAGIALPVMYKLGYNNNNCIGCVKGKKGYWNKIREDFPHHFERMAKLEREVGATCIKEDLPAGGSKRVYLDELNPREGYTPKPVVPDCGIFCQVEFAHIMDKRVEAVMAGELTI